MQKKNDEILGLKLFVKIIFRAIIDPIKYAPPSPRKILAFGKLNNVKESNIMIWEIDIIAKSLDEASKCFNPMLVSKLLNESTKLKSKSEKMWNVVFSHFE